jgi:hypothetical protein
VHFTFKPVAARRYGLLVCAELAEIRMFVFIASRRAAPSVSRLQFVRFLFT